LSIDWFRDRSLSLLREKPEFVRKFGYGIELESSKESVRGLYNAPKIFMLIKKEFTPNKSRASSLGATQHAPPKFKHSGQQPPSTHFYNL
jgi:hypothetical protein